jgi:hypothetical protein
MAILYAVADVYIDGWIHAREEGSDCHEIARRYHKRKDTDDADDAAVSLVYLFIIPRLLRGCVAAWLRGCVAATSSGARRRYRDWALRIVGH